MNYEPEIDRILAALEAGVRKRQCFVQTEVFHCNWRFGPYRIRGRVAEDVFQFRAIELNEIYRGRGVCSGLLRRLAAQNTLGGLNYRYIVGENCNDTCQRAFKAAGFHIDDPHWHRVAWIQVDQIELPMGLPDMRRRRA